MDKKSTYSEKSRKVWPVIIKNLITSPPPIKVSKKIAKIIKLRNPRLNYTAGDFLQAFLLLFLRRFLSEDIAYFVLPKYYGM